MFLEGRVAFVTAGGGPGIGSAICRALAREGAAIAVADVVAERAELVAAEITAGGGKALALPLDVSDQAAVRAAVERAAATLGGLHILVNHAGVGGGGPLETMTLEGWRSTMSVNLDGTFFCTQAAIPYMKSAGWGRVVNTASRAAYQLSEGGALAGLSAYAASKAGVVGFTRAAAAELGRYGITVNAVAPGLTSGLSGSDPIPAERAEQESRSRGNLPVVHPIRPVHPDEIAAGVLYLVGPGAARISGHVLHINGGAYFSA